MDRSGCAYAKNFPSIGCALPNEKRNPSNSVSAFAVIATPWHADMSGYEPPVESDDVLLMKPGALRDGTLTTAP